jgi:hypothetical protein
MPRDDRYDDIWPYERFIATIEQKAGMVARAEHQGAPR